MNILVLILTNLASFIGGAVAFWWITTRLIDIKERNVDDDSQPPGNGKFWLAIGLVFAIAATIGLVGQLQHKQTSDCLREYLSGAAPLTQARDAALQTFLNDLASFQHVDPKETEKAAVLRESLFEDLAAEIDADKALQDYRETHAADEVCPL